LEQLVQERTRELEETNSKLQIEIDVRREAEKASRQLAAIVEGSDDAITSKTLDGVITSWNKAAEVLYGYSAAEAIGQPTSLLTPPDAPDEVPNILKKIGQNERIVHYETIRIRKDGQKINIALSVSPLRNDMGEIIGASTIARDITERERMRKEREELIIELQEALGKVNVLKGLLPICAWCKKIRDDSGYWQQIEAYIRDHSEADFTHGICPACAQKAREKFDSTFPKGRIFISQLIV
jgi:PAS domain S-box-containing protein